jgi:hypothetical protein
MLYSKLSRSSSVLKLIKSLRVGDTDIIWGSPKQRSQKVVDRDHISISAMDFVMRQATLDGSRRLLWVRYEPLQGHVD